MNINIHDFGNKGLDTAKKKIAIKCNNEKEFKQLISDLLAIGYQYYGQQVIIYHPNKLIIPYNDTKEIADGMNARYYKKVVDYSNVIISHFDYNLFSIHLNNQNELKLRRWLVQNGYRWFGNGDLIEMITTPHYSRYSKHVYFSINTLTKQVKILVPHAEFHNKVTGGYNLISMEDFEKHHGSKLEKQHVDSPIKSFDWVILTIEGHRYNKYIFQLRSVCFSIEKGITTEHTVSAPFTNEKYTFEKGHIKKVSKEILDYIIRYNKKLSVSNRIETINGLWKWNNSNTYLIPQKPLESKLKAQKALRMEPTSTKICIHRLPQEAGILIRHKTDLKKLKSIFLQLQTKCDKSTTELLANKIENWWREYGCNTIIMPKRGKYCSLDVWNNEYSKTANLYTPQSLFEWDTPIYLSVGTTVKPGKDWGNPTAFRFDGGKWEKWTEWELNAIKSDSKGIISYITINTVPNSTNRVVWYNVKWIKSTTKLDKSDTRSNYYLYIPDKNEIITLSNKTSKIKNIVDENFNKPQINMVKDQIQKYLLRSKPKEKLPSRIYTHKSNYTLKKHI